MNSIKSEKLKKQWATGRVHYQKIAWWKTFPKLLMFIEEVSFDYQKSSEILFDLHQLIDSIPEQRISIPLSQQEMHWPHM